MAGDNAKNLVGRPPVMTKEVVEKLESIFRIGGTVDEACSYAGIHKQTYYNYLKDDQDFSTKMEAARFYSDVAAKNVVVANITKDKNVDTSKWWLEKRQFKPKSQEEKGNQVTNNLIVVGDENLTQYLYGFIDKLQRPTLPEDQTTSSQDATTGEGNVISKDTTGGDNQNP